jgi:Cu(I)/Ag(I) efflux system membrane fusion protein
MKPTNKTTIIIALSTLVIGFLVGLLIFGGSKEAVEPKDHSRDEASAQVWTCSMHPSVRRNGPGKCPICGMDLIPLGTDAASDNLAEIRMSQAAVQLANIRTSVVEKGRQPKVFYVDGKVQPDEQKIYTQTSHISGRIERLTVSFTGEYVRKGQEIATVYSPEMVTTQQELFEAHKIRETQPELYEAARAKLKNWKLSDDQIDGILQSGRPSEQFPVLSDISGVVLEKDINLGDYVKQGAPLYKIADLSRLWILFDIYESDMGHVKVGDEVEYTVQSIPGETFRGKISFIDPVINPKTRVARARISVNNSSLKLKPEMFVSGQIEGLAKGNSTDIVVPKSAVMWTGKRSIVYVRTSADVGVSFEMREVTLGASLGDSYVIDEGLKEGEEIATYGTFSIDAAAQLAGKPSMMNPQIRGKDTTLVHEHTDHGGEAADTGALIEIKHITLDVGIIKALDPLIGQYLTLKDAFVSDNLDQAKEEAEGLLNQMKNIKMSMFSGDAHTVWMQDGMKMQEYLQQVIAAGEIAPARAAFKPLSEHMIRIAQIFKPFEKTLYIQHCPMADDFKGADWLSTDENIMNPYFGESMLTCGEVTGEILNQ